MAFETNDRGGGWWWHRPIVTIPATNDDGKTTTKEIAVCCTPFCGGILTLVAIFLILLHIDTAHCDAKFSIQSISVLSPSSSEAATWHVDFLVKTSPRSRYSIYYDDDASVKLGSLNAAILNISHKRISRHTTAFSVAFVAEKNDTVSEEEQLDIKLRAKHKLYLLSNDAGHVDVKCRNLTQRHHNNIDKIQCHGSFTFSTGEIVL